MEHSRLPIVAEARVQAPAPPYTTGIVRLPGKMPQHGTGNVTNASHKAEAQKRQAQAERQRQAEAERERQAQAERERQAQAERERQAQAQRDAYHRQQEDAMRQAQLRAFGLPYMYQGPAVGPYMYMSMHQGPWDFGPTSFDSGPRFYGGCRGFIPGGGRAPKGGGWM